MDDLTVDSPTKPPAHLDRRRQCLRAFGIVGIAILAAAFCIGQLPAPPAPNAWPAERFVSREADVIGRIVAVSLLLAVIGGGLVVLINGWQHLALRDADVRGHFLLKFAWRTILVCVASVLVACGLEAVMMALGRV